MFRFKYSKKCCGDSSKKIFCHTHARAIFYRSNNTHSFLLSLLRCLNFYSGNSRVQCGLFEIIFACDRAFNNNLLHVVCEQNEMRIFPTISQNWYSDFGKRADMMERDSCDSWFNMICVQVILVSAYISAKGFILMALATDVKRSMRRFMCVVATLISVKDTNQEIPIV